MSLDQAWNLSERQRVVLRAACEAIYPADGFDGGATALGVPEFIEAQLAGPWGRGERMYLAAPFSPAPHAGHGWQARLTPRGAYCAGLAALERRAAELSETGQEQTLAASTVVMVLAEFERGEVQLGVTGFSSADFFALVRRNVAEGVFSDPIYGGNRDWAGWRLVGFETPLKRPILP